MAHTIHQVKREYKLDYTSTNLTLERATSKIEPIAILAAVRAGESLTPSPTTTTVALPVLPNVAAETS